MDLKLFLQLLEGPRERIKCLTLECVCVCFFYEALIMHIYYLHFTVTCMEQSDTPSE